MANSVEVAEKPQCDFCDEKADYDARLPGYGTWANLCQRHFKLYGCRLGTGHGQLLIVKERTNGDKDL